MNAGRIQPHRPRGNFQGGGQRGQVGPNRKTGGRGGGATLDQTASVKKIGSREVKQVGKGDKWGLTAVWGGGRNMALDTTLSADAKPLEGWWRGVVLIVHREEDPTPPVAQAPLLCRGAVLCTLLGACSKRRMDIECYM